jgi:hypothetical protein
MRNGQLQSPSCYKIRTWEYWDPTRVAGYVRKKMAPCGAKFQEATDWWAKSGKAMQDAVHRATAWEVTQNFEESEHGVCGLFGTGQRCTCRAKWAEHVISVTRLCKRFRNQLLTRARSFRGGRSRIGRGFPKCRTMHIRCTRVQKNSPRPEPWAF